MPLRRPALLPRHFRRTALLFWLVCVSAGRRLADFSCQIFSENQCTPQLIPKYQIRTNKQTNVEGLSFQRAPSVSSRAQTAGFHNAKDDTRCVQDSQTGLGTQRYANSRHQWGVIVGSSWPLNLGAVRGCSAVSSLRHVLCLFAIAIECAPGQALTL